MKSKFINLVNDVIKNEEFTLEQLKEVEPIMRENCNSCVKQFYKYYFITIVLIIAWFLINNSIIQQLTFLDASISNKKILMLSIPFISIIAFHLANSYFTFYQLIDTVLKAIYIKVFPPLKSTVILSLLEFPSFLSLEFFKTKLKNGTLINMLLLTFMAFLLNVLPIFINIWICILLIISFWNTWLILLPILYILISLKTFGDLVFYLKHL